jgi:hypothetical protein
MIDGQSASLYWHQAHISLLIYGIGPQGAVVLVTLLWGASSEERSRIVVIVEVFYQFPIEKTPGNPSRKQSHRNTVQLLHCWLSFRRLRVSREQPL